MGVWAIGFDSMMFPNVKYCYSLSITWISLARVEFPLPFALFMSLVFVCCAERHLPWTGVLCVSDQRNYKAPPLHYITFLWEWSRKRTTTSTWGHNNKCLWLQCITKILYSTEYVVIQPPGLALGASRWIQSISKQSTWTVNNIFLVIYLGRSLRTISRSPTLPPAAFYLDEQITHNKPQHSYPCIWLALRSSSCLNNLDGSYLLYTHRIGWHATVASGCAADTYDYNNHCGHT